MTLISKFKKFGGQLVKSDTQNEHLTTHGDTGSEITQFRARLVLFWSVQ